MNDNQKHQNEIQDEYLDQLIRLAYDRAEAIETQEIMSEEEQSTEAVPEDMVSGAYKMFLDKIAPEKKSIPQQLREMIQDFTSLIPKAFSKKKEDNSTDDVLVHRRLPVSIMVLILLMLLGVTAVAVGINLYNYFSDRDSRLDHISEQAANVTADPAQLQSEHLGTVQARIDSAYYDGEYLSVGVVIENATRIERYTLTDEEIAKAEMVVDPLPPVTQTEEEQRILAEYLEAVQNSTPYGYAIYTVAAKDHTYADGISLPPYKEIKEYDASGTDRFIREFEMPLPEEVQNREQLSIRIPLSERVSICYFDGKDTYHYNIYRSDVGAISGIVSKTEAEKRMYRGSAEIEDVLFSGEISLSQMQGNVVISSNPEIFQILSLTDNGFTYQTTQWRLKVFDENGTLYRNTEGYNLTTANPMQIYIQGSGVLPEELHVYLLLLNEETERYEYYPNPDAEMENPHLILTTDQ